MDQRITYTLERLVKSLMEFEDLKLEVGESGNPFLGSMREGSFSAGFFETNLSVPTIDIDFAVKGKGFGINREYKHCIIKSNKSGLVYLNFEKINDKKYFRSVLLEYTDNETIIDQIVKDSGGYIKSNLLKEILLQSKAFSVNVYTKTISFWFNIPRERINVKQIRKVTKSSTDQTTEIYLDGDLKLIIHVDFPILVQLGWSCPYVEVWQKRQRKWPDLDLLSEELNISYLIAKTSREERNNINATTFQYSFAHIENKIMALLSTNQRTLFYTAKIVFKKWIQPSSDVYLPSFLVKNTMFWICEQAPPEDHLWKFLSNKDFLTSLHYFFTKLRKYFREGFLPYYFIPEINLLEGVPKEILEEVITTLRVLLVEKYMDVLPDDRRRKLVESWMGSMELALYGLEDILNIAKLSSVLDIEAFIDNRLLNIPS